MVIKCNEEFQASGEIFWGSVVFSQPLNHAIGWPATIKCWTNIGGNSFNVHLLKILLVERSSIQQGIGVFLELCECPCLLDSDSETEVPNLGKGRGRRGLANDPSIWSPCLPRFVERMNDSTYNIRRLGLRSSTSLYWPWGECYWRCPGFCLWGHCGGEPHSMGPQRYLGFLLEVTAGTVDTASKACVPGFSASPHCIPSLLLPFSACTLFWITLGPKYCGSRNMAL